MKAFSIIAILILSILLYGYWHSCTHATFHVSLDFNRGLDNEIISLPELKIQFMDAKGAVLAKGISDKQFSYIHLIHPVHGDCHEAEKEAPFSKEAKASWQECFEQQSMWIAEWIKDVHKIKLEFGNCRQQNIPIIMNYNSDWYFWWVPHPHIGGKPYSYYSTTIKINEQNCV